MDGAITAKANSFGGAPVPEGAKCIICSDDGAAKDKVKMLLTGCTHVIHLPCLQEFLEDSEDKKCPKQGCQKEIMQKDITKIGQTFDFGLYPTYKFMSE